MPQTQMSFVQTEQIRGEGDSSIFKNLCSGTTFALFGVSLSIFLPARNNASCFPGYLMPISSYYNLLCLLYSLTAWNIQDKYCSEDDDTLCREFVGADIKHVWGSGSLEIRDEDLWPKAAFFEFPGQRRKDVGVENKRLTLSPPSNIIG